MQFGQLRFEVDGNRVSRLLQDILDVMYSSLIMTPELVLRIRVVTQPSSAGSIVAGVDNRKRREIDTGTLQVSDSPLLASTVSVPLLPRGRGMRRRDPALVAIVTGHLDTLQPFSLRNVPPETCLRGVEK